MHCTCITFVDLDKYKYCYSVSSLDEHFCSWANASTNMFKLKKKKKKLESLLTLLVENFFSEIRTGAYDMPMQLQFDFRFSRTMKEHLKQLRTTKLFSPHEWLPESEISIALFSSSEDGSTCCNTLDKGTDRTNERLAHEIWPECTTENGP